MKNLLLALLVLVMPACAATNTTRFIDFITMTSLSSNDFVAGWSITASNTVKIAGATLVDFMNPVISNYVKSATNGLGTGTTVNTNVLVTTNALTTATNNVVTNLVAYTKAATNTLDVALRAVVTNHVTASSNFATVNISQIVLTNALGVTVGGTGTNTFTAGRLLAGNGTNPVTEVTLSTGLLLAGGVLTATNVGGTAIITNTSVGSFTVSNRFQNLYQTLSYTGDTNVLVDLSLGNNFQLNVTNNFYLTFTNVSDGQSGNILFIQDMQSNAVHTSFTYNPVNVLTNGSLELSTTNIYGIDRWKFDTYSTNVFVYSLTNWFPRKFEIADTGLGGGGSCPADGSPDVEQARIVDNLDSNLIGQTARYYGGQIWSNATERTICKVGYRLYPYGDIGSKTYKCHVFSLTGNNLNTAIGSSDAVSGSNAWTDGDWVYFSFSIRPTLTANTPYAIVIAPDQEADGTNAIYVEWQNGNGTIAGNWTTWATDKNMTDSRVDNQDTCIQIYYYD